MNVSCLSEDESVFEEIMRIVEEETQIFEVFEPNVTSRERPQESDILTETTIQNHATFVGDSVSIHVETAHLSKLIPCDSAILTDTYRTVQTPVFPNPVQNDISDNFDNDFINIDDADNDPDNQLNFLNGLKDCARKHGIDHKVHSETKF